VAATAGSHLSARQALQRERIVAGTPLARLGSPEEIALAVHFLATAPFITGQVLAVDGGLVMM